MKTKPIALILGSIGLALLSSYAFAHGMSEADKLAIIEGGNLRYMWLGATHMLTGYDHLAFVFGIIFFLDNFREVAKYVTAFTLGHSVTLILATFKAIQLNYFLIDAIIGLSVGYIAFANIDGFRKYLAINPPNMMLMIVVLGLIHGFGLSTRLQELPLSEDSLLLNIISFNVGIELGQIGALTLMLILIAGWRRRPSFQAFSLVANYGLMVTGSVLFLMQIHGYIYSDQTEELNGLVLPTQNQESVRKESEFNQDTTWTDSITIKIPARSGKEYKLYLSKGSTLKYSWQTKDTTLFFDFHGEPEGDTSGFFKSFDKGTDGQSSGSFTAFFTGPHGWYWENSTPHSVTVVLKANGDYQRLDLK